jgi:hypothetical protein
MSDVSLRVDAARHVAVLTWPDIDPAFPVWEGAVMQLIASPDFQPHYGVVADWSRVSRAPAAHLVESAVAFVAGLRTRGLLQGRWATVVKQERLHMFGMGRMTEIKAELHHVPHRLFTDLTAALEWAAETPHSAVDGR